METMIFNDENFGFLGVWKVGKWVESVSMEWFSFSCCDFITI